MVAWIILAIIFVAVLLWALIDFAMFLVREGRRERIRQEADAAVERLRERYAQAQQDMRNHRQ